jgi:hypothetical protein
MSPPRLWPLTNCTTNYGPVLSSEREPQDEEQSNCPAWERGEKKNLVMGPNGVPDTKMNRPTDRRSQHELISSSFPLPCSAPRIFCSHFGSVTVHIHYGPKTSLQKSGKQNLHTRLRNWHSKWKPQKLPILKQNQIPLTASIQNSYRITDYT